MMAILRIDYRLRVQIIVKYKRFFGSHKWYAGAPRYSIAELELNISMRWQAKLAKYLFSLSIIYRSTYKKSIRQHTNTKYKIMNKRRTRSLKHARDLMNRIHYSAIDHFPHVYFEWQMTFHQHIHIEHTTPIVGEYTHTHKCAL